MAACKLKRAKVAPRKHRFKNATVTKHHRELVGRAGKAAPKTKKAAAAAAPDAVLTDVDLFKMLVSSIKAT